MYDNTIKVKHNRFTAYDCDAGRRSNRNLVQDNNARFVNWRAQEHRADRHDAKVFHSRGRERMAPRNVTNQVIDAINRAAERFEAGELPVSNRTALIVCGLIVAVFIAQAFGWWLA